MEPLSVFGSFVQQVLVSCFSDSFVHRTTQQLDSTCRVTSGSQLLFKLFTKQSFISANTYEKYIVSKEYCIARQDDKMCFLPNCIYDIKLKGDIEEFLQRMDAICFNY